MQETKIAWLAGIIDGEGCFTIFNKTVNHRSGNTGVTPSANITITNSSTRILEACQEIMREIDVKFTQCRSHNDTRRIVRRISVRNYASIILLIDAILPYMVGKRGQAEVMKEFIEKAAVRKGFEADEERQAYMRRLRELKQSDQFAL